MKSAYLLNNFLPPNFFLLRVAMSFFFFVRWRKERKDENSCALDIQEFYCREMSVFGMGLSRNITSCDKALLSGRICNILTSTWFVCLVPWSDRSSTLVDVWSLSFLMVCWGRSGGCTGWTRWWLIPSPSYMSGHFQSDLLLWMTLWESSVSSASWEFSVSSFERLIRGSRGLLV